jgi:hypothetical protein
MADRNLLWLSPETTFFRFSKIISAPNFPGSLSISLKQAVDILRPDGPS